MANDYSLDPFETEESNLDAQLKAAVAARLRAGQSPLWGADAFDRAQYAGTERRVAKEKSELARRAQEQLEGDTAGFSDDARALMRNPATRTEGAKVLGKEAETRYYARQDAEEKAARQAARGMSGPSMGGTAVGGDAADYMDARAQAEDDIRSRDPAKAARGKAMLEALKAQDPTHTTAIINGRSVSIPSALDTLRQREETTAPFKDTMIQVPTGRGDETKAMSQQEWLRQQRGGALPQAVGASSGAGTTGGSPTAAAGPTQLPSPSTSVFPGARAATSPPIGDTQGMRPVPGGMQVDPNVQRQRDGMRLQVLSQELAQEMPRAQAGDPTAQRNVAALQKEIAQTAGRNGISPQSVGQPPQSAAGQAAAGGREPSPPPEAFLDPSKKITMQVGTPGTRNPGAEKMYQETLMGEQTAARDKFKADKVGDFAQKFRYMKEHADDPTYSGGFAGLQMGFDQYVAPILGQNADPRYAATKNFQNDINDVIQNKAKLLGTNPSDADREFIEKGLPSLKDDPASRKMIIEKLADLAERQVQKQAKIQEMVSGGYRLGDAEAAYDIWEKQDTARRNAEDRAKKQGGAVPPNPTQAGGSASSLPSAVSAAQASVPGGGGPAPGGGESSFGRKVYEGLEDVDRSIKALPRAAMAVPGAAVDTVGNVARGAAELFGRERGQDMAAVAAQDARRKTDPAYNQARAFTDIAANPLSYLTGGVGGAAFKGAALAEPTLMKLAAAAGVQGLLQPAQSAGAQVFEGVKSAAIGTFLGGLMKLLPAASATNAAVEEGAKKFPKASPTSAQLNPDSLESKLSNFFNLNDAAISRQVKGLSDGLREQAGITGKNITRESIDAARTAQQGSVDKLLTKATTKVGTSEQKALTAILTDRETGEITMNPALVKIFDGSTAKKMNASDLYKAWDEIGTTVKDPEVAKQAQDILQGMINKAVRGDKKAQYEALKDKMKNLQDVDRVFNESAGLGTGSLSGSLAPSHITGTKGEFVGEAMPAARNYVKGLGLKDQPKPIIENDMGFITAPLAVARKIAGPTLNALDVGNRVASSPAGKFTVDALRRLAPSFASRITGDQNAP